MTSEGGESKHPRLDVPEGVFFLADQMDLDRSLLSPEVIDNLLFPATIELCSEREVGWEHDHWKVSLPGGSAKLDMLGRIYEESMFLEGA
jgi:hypothetical protein